MVQVINTDILRVLADCRYYLHSLLLIVIYVMILTLPVPNIFVVNETSFFPFENLRAFYRKSNYLLWKGGGKIGG